MTQADDNAAGAQGDDANNNDEDRVIEATGLGLDDAHDKVLHDFDAEADQQALEDAAAGGDAELQGQLKADADAAAAAAGDDEDEDAEAKAAAEAAAAAEGGDDDDKSKGAGGDAAGAAGDDAGNKGLGETVDYTPGAAKIPTAEELKAPEPPVVDSDVEKPGDYKVEFTDIDGKKYYVTSVAQLPEDFEPKSQRDYGISIESLAEERSKFAKDQSTYETQKADFDNKSTVRNLQAGWGAEIQTMTTSKVLPEKREERDKVVEGVFKLMNDELDKGNAIDSFAIAHELYMARTGRAEAEAAATAKAEADKTARKVKGGKVMGGGARSGAGSGGSGGRSSSDGNGGRVLEAPMPGTSLDDIHNKIMHR